MQLESKLHILVQSLGTGFNPVHRGTVQLRRSFFVENPNKGILDLKLFQNGTKAVRESLEYGPAAREF
jgi:hypothetical protein